jgi:amidohydrolase
MVDGAGDPIFAGVAAMLADLEALYKDVHRHPELSMQEERTAALAAEWLQRAGFEVTSGIGRTGVVGLLRNGEGPVMMLRADMDALPVSEQTGLDYASATEGVMHACGHDMHVAWLAGATTALAAARDGWHGTLLAVFQPAEETAAGARAMIDDGLFDRFPKPDVVLGQHVMPAPAGSIGVRAGVITSAADSFEIRMFGRGAHGSMPEASVDPVVMAAATVLRLQTIVSREVAAAQSVVVTIGALQAGTKENVIPDEAVIKLNVRTFDEGVRTGVLDAIRRIVAAEAQASGAPRSPESRRSTATSSSATTSTPPRGCEPRSRRGSARSASSRSRRSRPARTSARSAASGTSQPFSGQSAAPTRTPTARRRRQAAFPSCRPTTTRASRP